MSKLVTIFGGSGFVGRYVAQRMAKQGWRVRVAVRRPNEAIFVKPYGVVGQVEPIFCNIRDDDSVRAAMFGADAVVNCVGILEETGKNKFDAVQHEGAERIARIASEEGVQSLAHVSAIGADPESDSQYAKSKGLGEEAVRAAFPSAVILRPSIVFGPEDEFFNRFSAMARLSPVIPLFGAETKFQPVYVDDVAAAVEKAVGDLPDLALRLESLIAATEATVADFGENAALGREAQEALRDIQGAAKAVESLARALERRPNSVILGR